MGESLIVQRGGSVFKLPVLSPLLPADLTVKEAPLLNARFSVEIQNPGTPAQYTYQWFLDGSPVSGATESSCVINQGVARGEHFIYCKITNKAGTVSSHSALFTIKPYVPSFSYTGLSQIIEEGNYNWKLKLLSTGTLVLNEDIGKVDAFLVGGGGAGVGANGGGGGYTQTVSFNIQKGTPYSIVIGAGGMPYPSFTPAGTTNAFNTSAAGGFNGGGGGGKGGSGGASLGGVGGSNGGDGGGSSGGQGQGSTTREFGEMSGELYSGGGGGGSTGTAAGGEGGGGRGGWGTSPDKRPFSGTVNTGGGGGGNYDGTGGAGGSGIVIIRNHRG